MTPAPVRAVGELRFVVVGAYVTDCFVRTPRLPAWGSEYEVRSVRTAPGGKALNQAVALARLGARVSAVGVVGDDGVGRDVLGTLTREGIDVGCVDRRAGVATAVCVCLVADSGETSILWHIDDDVAVTGGTVRAAAEAMAAADAVLVTFEMPAEVVGEVIRAASRAGVRVIVQPAPLFAEPGAATLLPWGLVDVVVPNEAEARALLGDRAGSLAAGDLAGAVAAALGVAMVVVTLGAAGCVTFAGGVTTRYPAREVVAVDTTGASDAFAASFAAGLVAGGSVAEAVDAGQAAAASAIQRPGGHESMPSPVLPG